MSGYELIPNVSLNELSDFTQHVFRVCRGPEGGMLANKTPDVLAAFDELVAAGYARIVPDLMSSGKRIEMLKLHGSFAMADSIDGTQDVLVEIVDPVNPDSGEGTLLAVITNCEFSSIGDRPWPVAGIFAFHETLTDLENGPIRTASISLANPVLVRSYGAHRQVWIGTLTTAYLYPAGADVAVASLEVHAEREIHRFLPPSITSIIPSVVRVTVRPSQSFLNAGHSE